MPQIDMIEHHLSPPLGEYVTVEYSVEDDPDEWYVVIGAIMLDDVDLFPIYSAQCIDDLAARIEEKERARMAKEADDAKAEDWHYRQLDKDMP